MAQNHEPAPIAENEIDFEQEFEEDFEQEFEEKESTPLENFIEIAEECIYLFSERRFRDGSFHPVITPLARFIDVRNLSWMLGRVIEVTNGNEWGATFIGVTRTFFTDVYFYEDNENQEWNEFLDVQRAVKLMKEIVLLLPVIREYLCKSIDYVLEILLTEVDEKSPIHEMVMENRAEKFRTLMESLNVLFNAMPVGMAFTEEAVRIYNFSDDDLGTLEVLKIVQKDFAVLGAAILDLFPDQKDNFKPFIQFW